MADTYTDQFIAFIQMSLPQRRATWWRGRCIQWMALLLGWGWLGIMLYLLGPVAFQSSLDQYSFASPGLGTAAWDVIVVILIPIATFGFTVLILPAKKMWFASRVVRAGVLAGNSPYTAYVFDQPPPLTGDEVPRDAASFSALKLPRLRRAMAVFALLDGIATLAAAVFIIVFWQRNTTNTGGLPETGLDLAIFILPVLSLGRIWAIYGVSQIVPHGWWVLLPGRRKKLLAVDDLGIRWYERRWRRCEYTLAWQDIAAFGVYRQFTGLSVNYTYLLFGNNQSFSWIVPANTKEAAIEASALFARLVVTRTGRPLEDLTGAIDAAKTLSIPSAFSVGFDPGRSAVAQTLRAEVAAVDGKKRRSSHQSPDYSEVMSASAATSLGSKRERPLQMKARYLWLNMALMVLVAIGFVGVWMVDQQQHDEYYRTLAPRIAAQTPLYSDPLTSANNAWPLQEPTKKDSSTYRYANGGYTMTGGPSGYTIYATNDVQYIDVAVAVTARQIGSSKYDGVGLVARSLAATSDAEDDNIVFTVSPSTGSWSLYHYQPGHANTDDNWKYLDGGDSSVIHTGAGAENRLLLVLHGTEYLCYINGHFVARDVDTTVTASSPKFGYTGMFVNDNATTGVFNDFAVYDLPPAYQPLFHDWKIPVLR